MDTKHFTVKYEPRRKQGTMRRIIPQNELKINQQKHSYELQKILIIFQLSTINYFKDILQQGCKEIKTLVSSEAIVENVWQFLNKLNREPTNYLICLTNFSFRKMWDSIPDLLLFRFVILTQSTNFS